MGDPFPFDGTLLLVSGAAILTAGVLDLIALVPFGLVLGASLLGSGVLHPSRSHRPR